MATSRRVRNTVLNNTQRVLSLQQLVRLLRAEISSHLPEL